MRGFDDCREERVWCCDVPEFADQNEVKIEEDGKLRRMGNDLLVS